MSCKQSLLVIDTPDSCTECKLCEPIGRSNVCVVLSKIVTELDKTIHTQCPLQDTTELLEALGIMTYKEMKQLPSYNNAYNKLYKALGGE